MNFILQKRDIDLMRILNQMRFLTLEHVTTLCFEDRTEAARKRIRKLELGGLLMVQRLIANESPFVWITRPAFRLLQDHECASVRRKWANQPAFATLHHERSVRDFVVMVLHCARQHSLDILDPSIDSYSLRFRNGPFVVRPDGFFLVRKSTLSHYFFEVDRGTEPRHSLMKRVEAYRMFYKSGGFAVRKGGTTIGYKEFPFRVLFIFSSERRMRNFIEDLRSYGFRGFVLVTTLVEACSRPFDRIWHSTLGVESL